MPRCWGSSAELLVWCLVVLSLVLVALLRWGLAGLLQRTKEEGLGLSDEAWPLNGTEAVTRPPGVLRQANLPGQANAGFERPRSGLAGAARPGKNGGVPAAACAASAATPLPRHRGRGRCR